MFKPRYTRSQAFTQELLRHLEQLLREKLVAYHSNKRYYEVKSNASNADRKSHRSNELDEPVGILIRGEEPEEKE